MSIEKTAFVLKVNTLVLRMMEDKDMVSEKLKYSFRNYVEAKEKKKYTNIDMGIYFPTEDWWIPQDVVATWGTLIIENETGDIYWIKAYWQIHRGHKYGNLDTIENYFWGNYYPIKKPSS